MCTTLGTLHSYGSNFQYLRQRFHEDETKCIYMASIYPDKIVCVYEDNTVAVYELPKLHLLSVLTDKWLPSKYGNISTCYVDEQSLRPYIYFGTADGTLHVIEVTSNNDLRVVDFNISTSKLNLPKDSTIIDCGVYPKDEKYIAIAYNCPPNYDGVIILFDFVKNKVFKQFSCKSITCLSWVHSGDLLYAGTLYYILKSLRLT